MVVAAVMLPCLPMTIDRDQPTPAESQVQTRYPRRNLAACILPWTEDYTLDVPVFEEHIQDAIDDGFESMYLMGTAGEGYALQPEEIIPKLREAEVLMSQGTTQKLAAKQIGISTQTLIRWRKEYGGLRMNQAKRLKELEKENTRLKRLLADAELDKAILKETASGNF